MISLRVFAALSFIALPLAGCANATNPNATTSASANCQAGKKMPPSDAAIEQVMLCVKSGTRVRGFTTEMARSPQQQQQGLMFRTAIADTNAMLFPFPDTRMASFWMKNTLIPLDIIFIGADHRIVNIAANTTPYSLEPVESDAPVTAVLEVRGGLTAQFGIRAGDRVDW